MAEGGGQAGGTEKYSNHLRRRNVVCEQKTRVARHRSTITGWHNSTTGRTPADPEGHVVKNEITSYRHRQENGRRSRRYRKEDPSAWKHLEVQVELYKTCRQQEGRE